MNNWIGGIIAQCGRSPPSAGSGSACAGLADGLNCIRAFPLCSNAAPRRAGLLDVVRLTGCRIREKREALSLSATDALVSMAGSLQGVSQVIPGYSRGG